jgi:hypothetical protein
MTGAPPAMRASAISAHAPAKYGHLLVIDVMGNTNHQCKQSAMRGAPFALVLRAIARAVATRRERLLRIRPGIRM